MTETFYEVLGVAEDATTDEIESAYRERLKETHPDVSDDDDAGQETQTLVEARDVLVDEDERAHYDQVGHAAYVGGTAADAAADVANSDGSGGDDSAGGPQQTRDRSRRERAARQRVRQERRRGPTESQSDPTEGSGDGTTDQKQNTARTESARRARSTSGEKSTGRTGSTGRGKNTRPNGKPGHNGSAGQTRPGGTQPTGGTQDNTYDVRRETTTTESFGPILPSGQRLTLLGIFFALYPVMVFSAFLPAFPLVVNLVVVFAAVVLIAYLQSMPRIALLVFGGWSAIGVVGLLLSGVGLFSLVGVAVIFGTVLPFGFSVLTASALRY